MKLFLNSLLIILISFLLKNQNLGAQTVPPEYIMYEKTIFDPTNPTIILPNYSTQFWVSIYDQVGNLIFKELHFLTTENNGNVEIKIGDGLFVSGSANLLNQINWKSGKYFMQIEYDFNNQLIVLNPEQLVSTPYSYYSQFSGNGIDSIYYSNGILTTTFENGNTSSTGPVHLPGNGILISNDTISLDTNSSFFSSFNNSVGGINHFMPDGFNNVQAVTHTFINSNSNMNTCPNSVIPYTVPNGKNFYLTNIEFSSPCYQGGCSGIYANGILIIGPNGYCAPLISGGCGFNSSVNFIIGENMVLGYNCGSSPCNAGCAASVGRIKGYLIDKSVTIVFQSTAYTVPPGKTFIKIGTSSIPTIYPSGAVVPAKTNGYLYP
jgi:hypothetical protein